EQVDQRVGFRIVDPADAIGIRHSPDVARVLKVVDGRGGKPLRRQLSTGSPAVRQACMPPSRLKTCCMPTAAAISAATALRWPTSHTNTTLSDVIASCGRAMI